MPRNMKKDRVYTTDSAFVAFDAAMAWANWVEWASKEGPAAVRNVEHVSGGWRITYRLIKHWGKEAW